VLARVMRQLKLRAEHMAELGSFAAQMQALPDRRLKPKGHGVYRKSGLDAEKRKEICRRFKTYFEAEAPYLDEGLNLETIAGRLKVTRHNLSEAVNVEMNRSIAYLINSYRTDHFCELMRRQPHASILELLFQSGYNSKSVFNRWFKTIKKTTLKKFKQTL
jgi:AraC-like DNA-binding protein